MTHLTLWKWNGSYWVLAQRFCCNYFSSLASVQKYIYKTRGFYLQITIHILQFLMLEVGSWLYSKGFCVDEMMMGSSLRTPTSNFTVLSPNGWLILLEIWCGVRYFMSTLLYLSQGLVHCYGATDPSLETQMRPRMKINYSEISQSIPSMSHFILKE